MPRRSAPGLTGSNVLLSAAAVAEMRSELPEVADHVVAAVIGEVPSYTDAFSGPMGETIRNAVQLALDEELPPAPFTRPTTATPSETFVFEEPSNEDDLIRMARMAEEQRRLQMEQRAELLKNELGRLSVQSVMAGGRMPVARINGQPVTIGKFLGSFEVVDIAKQSVFITADGMTWELPIGMPARLLD